MSKAASLGLDCGEATASAAAILGATGVDTTSLTDARKRTAEATDNRTSMQKLEATTPEVASAIRAFVQRADPPTSLAIASPGFVERAHAATTPCSSLDHLHDLIFEAGVWHQQLKDDAHRAEMVEKLRQWRGALHALGEEKLSTMTAGEKEEAAATQYLRMVRELEGARTAELRNLTNLINAKRLKAEMTLKDLDPVSRRQKAPIIALFATFSHEIALYIDERDGIPKGGLAAPLHFLITRPPLPRDMLLKHGVLRKVAPPPPPPPKPPPPPPPPPPAATFSAVCPYPVGSRVLLHSFESDVGKPLNGKMGTIRQWDGDRKLYHVVVDGVEGLKGIKHPNCKIVPSSRTEGSPYVKQDLPPGWTGYWHVVPSGGYWMFTGPTFLGTKSSQGSATKAWAIYRKGEEQRQLESADCVGSSTASMLPSGSAPPPPIASSPTPPAGPAAPAPPPAPPQAPSPVLAPPPAECAPVPPPTGEPAASPPPGQFELVKGRCGTPGCTLPDFHSGMCSSISVTGKRSSPGRAPGSMSDKRPRSANGSPSPLGRVG